MKWNEHQQDIFRCVRDSSSHMVVVARAGTGKTTTILEAIRYLNPRSRVLLCAFNKRIQVELKAKAPPWVRVQTLHSVGCSALRRAGIGKVVDPNKTKLIVKALIETDEGDVDNVLARVITKLVGLAKNTLAQSRDALTALYLDYDLGSDECDIPPEIIVEYAYATLGLCKEDLSTIDFDDMIWLPCVLGKPPYKQDVVFVDEAQDLNASQRWLVERAVGRTGRLVAVGDDRQAIYQFRGAGSDVLKSLTTQFNADVKPLSVTYRCPKAIVKIAQNIVKDYRYAEDAPEGQVTSVNEDSMYDLVGLGDFILSRSNAPLIRTCLKLLTLGKPATIAGSEMERTIAALVKKSKAGTTAELEQWLQKYKKLESKRLLPDHEAAYELLCDKVECVRALSEGLEFVSELLQRLESLFSSSEDDDIADRVIICSSVHKAKGLERDRVWLLSKSFRRGSTVEDNIYYVAVTRAKQALYFVE